MALQSRQPLFPPPQYRLGRPAKGEHSRARGSDAPKPALERAVAAFGPSKRVCYRKDADEASTPPC